MNLSVNDINKLAEIANKLDKTGEQDKMAIAGSIDEIIKAQVALRKIAIDIIHPKLLSWLSANYPKALQNVEVAKNALKALFGLGSGSIEGVAHQDINNLRQELKKVISGQEESVGVHEISA